MWAFSPGSLASGDGTPYSGADQIKSKHCRYHRLHTRYINRLRYLPIDNESSITATISPPNQLRNLEVTKCQSIREHACEEFVVPQGDTHFQRETK